MNIAILDNVLSNLNNVKYVKLIVSTLLVHLYIGACYIVMYLSIKPMQTDHHLYSSLYQSYFNTQFNQQLVLHKTVFDC